MKTVKKSLLSLILLAAASAAGADEPAAPVPAGVAEIGRINGTALACSYPDVVARAKGVIVASMAKTRAVGEAFEAATGQAFQAQTADRANCPPRAELAVKLEAAALQLSAPATHQSGAVAEVPEIGINPRYLLQAANGRAIMDGDFAKRFQLITFGYTSCPDICPTTLVEMADVLKRLGDRAGDLQALFVSLDPERDTLAVLRTYTAFFDQRILGATGSPELVRRAAENFKVRYEKVREPGAPAERYALDHTAGMYLLAPGGQFLARFPYGAQPADIAERIAAEMKRRPAVEEAAPAAEAASAEDRK